MKKTKEEMIAMVTPEMVKAGETLMMAQALVQTVKPIVEAYEKEILNRHQFLNLGEKKMLEEHGKGDKYVEQVILDSKHTYLISDEDAVIYEKERREACVKSNLKVEKPEYCPLLVAEDLERQAKRAFLKTMVPITKIDPDEIDMYSHGKKLTDLSLGLIASMGFFKNSAKQIMQSV